LENTRSESQPGPRLQCALFEHSKNNVSQILQEVKTIRNLLHAIRNCPPRRLGGVFAATIPAHHLYYSWMCSESQ
jgi:hypothetical protein